MWFPPISTTYGSTYMVEILKGNDQNGCIKTHGSESRGQEEAACTRVFWPTQPLQWVIYTDGSSQILKCYNSAIIAVTLT